ncbi:MAG TPA: spore germination protein [Bacilli bacterium]|nr:spore germination protein [Bacilli bacterium]
MNLFKKLIFKSHQKPSYDTNQSGSPGKGMNKQSDSIPKGKIKSFHDSVETIKKTFKDCNDLRQRLLPPGTITDSPVFVAYFESLVEIKVMEQSFHTINALVNSPKNLRPHEASGELELKAVEKLEEAVKMVLYGWTLFIVQSTGQAFVVNTFKPPVRNLTRSETESTILGPQVAFTESLQLNLSLVRQELRTPDLKVKSIILGKYTQRVACVMFVDGIAQQEYIETIENRLNAIKFDGILDAASLALMIGDNPFSPFPQFHVSERPEKMASQLLDGKIVIMLDGNPFALSGPASFIEFFQASDDYSNSWLAATLVRTLRIMGVLISISLSALYVAVVTFHYQMIPSDMLVTLTQSRSRVPFPPLYETLLMEITIELLREAGARLPTKVGQTIGIVGGIVIGQAAVTAGLTSNILIIAVALSTLGSFIAPSYLMASTLRTIRFPLIIVSGMFGLFGLLIGLLMMVLHFLRLSSMGAPYFTPFSPLRLSDLKDTIVRAPMPWMVFRPTNTRPRDTMRTQFQMPTTEHAIPTNTATDSGKGEEP